MTDDKLRAALRTALEVWNGIAGNNVPPTLNRAMAKLEAASDGFLATSATDEGPRRECNHEECGAWCDYFIRPTLADRPSLADLVAGTGHSSDCSFGGSEHDGPCVARPAVPALDLRKTVEYVVGRMERDELSGRNAMLTLRAALAASATDEGPSLGPAYPSSIQARLNALTRPAVPALDWWTPQHTSQCAAQDDNDECICGVGPEYARLLALAASATDEAYAADHQEAERGGVCYTCGASWPCMFARPAVPALTHDATCAKSVAWDDAGSGPDCTCRLAASATDEPDPERTGMPKCQRCGDIAYRPEPVSGRKQAWRCGGCHRTLSKCTCAASATDEGPCPECGTTDPTDHAAPCTRTLRRRARPAASATDEGTEVKRLIRAMQSDWRFQQLPATRPMGEEYDAAIETLNGVARPAVPALLDEAWQDGVLRRHTVEPRDHAATAAAPALDEEPMVQTMHPDDGHIHLWGCRLCGVDRPLQEQPDTHGD